MNFYGACLNEPYIPSKRPYITVGLKDAATHRNTMCVALSSQKNSPVCHQTSHMSYRKSYVLHQNIHTFHEKEPCISWKRALYSIKQSVLHLNLNWCCPSRFMPDGVNVCVWVCSLCMDVFFLGMLMCVCVCRQEKETVRVCLYIIIQTHTNCLYTSHRVSLNVCLNMNIIYIYMNITCMYAYTTSTYACTYTHSRTAHIHSHAHHVSHHTLPLSTKSNTMKQMQPKIIVNPK